MIGDELDQMVNKDTVCAAQSSADNAEIIPSTSRGNRSFALEEGAHHQITSRQVVQMEEVVVQNRAKGMYLRTADM